MFFPRMSVSHSIWISNGISTGQSERGTSHAAPIMHYVWVNSFGCDLL